MKDARMGHPRDQAGKKAHRARCAVDPIYASDTVERTGVTRTVIETKKLANKGMFIGACAETVKKLLPENLLDAEMAACKANGTGASAFQVPLGARPAGSNSIVVKKSVLKALGRKGAKWRLGRLGKQVKHLGLGNTREEAGGKAVVVVEYVLADGRVLVVLEPETAEEPDLGQIEVVEGAGEEDGEEEEDDDDEEEDEEAGP